MQPLISVIIPVYNTAAYLARCLDSVLSQSYPQLEVVLINDGSSDDSGAICDDYAAKDSRITVIHQANAGIGITRNVGLHHSTGDLIVFVDSDDFLFPDALQHLYDCLVEDDSDLVIANFVKVFPDNTRSAPCYRLSRDTLDSAQMLSLLGDFGSVSTGPCAKLYRKEILEGITYPSRRIGEDTVTFPHILERCNRISLLPEPVFGYFQQPNSLMRNKNEQTKIGDVDALLYISRYLWDRRHLDGAATWYGVAAKNAMHIQSRRDRLAGFHAAFDRKIRHKLFQQLSFSCKLAWVVLHLPLACSIYTRLKK